jgi:cytidyltransferase-like protein
MGGRYASMKIVLVTGGFDPLHSGHIAYFNAAKQLGDLLFVGLNSDDWLARKKGQPFMPYRERTSIVNALHVVDGIVGFNDDDNSSKQAIINLRKAYPDDEIIFANGGDRTKENIPEMDVADDNVSFVFGVGGEDKANSSSWILQEWKAPKTERIWGYYRVLHEVEGCKVKELTIEPKQSLSMQQHKKRKEHWVITEGKCKLTRIDRESGELYTVAFKKHDTIDIDVKQWHQLSNPYDKPCRVVEIQYGKECVEEDIVRKDA